MIKERRLLILCDANTNYGLGHLVRSVSVAMAAMKSGWVVYFSGNFSGELALKILEEANIENIIPKSNLNFLVSELNISVVHVDSYQIGADALHQVRSAGAILSSMEDGTFGRRHADIAIDSSLGAELPGSISMKRPKFPNEIILRGIQYAPMRPEVLHARESRAASQRETNSTEILVVMGGTDATRSSLLIASLCSQVSGVSGISVIAPVESWDLIKTEVENVRLSPPGINIFEYVVSADLVVSAAGTTTWELACIGTPSIIVSVVDNQVAGYQEVIRQRLARGLGTIDEVRANPAAAIVLIQGAIDDLRKGKDWSEVGLNTVDGLGAQRIVSSWEVLLARRSLEEIISE